MTGAGAYLFTFMLVQSAQITEPQAHIALTLACGEQLSDLGLTLQNDGPRDTALLLGIALANGKSYFPTALIVEIRRQQSSEFDPLLHASPAAIAGRIDHWVVTLPNRARFTLALSSTDFVSPAAAVPGAPPEEMRVRLTGRPIASDLNLDLTGMKLWNVWRGTATSNALRLADCRR